MKVTLFIQTLNNPAKINVRIRDGRGISLKTRTNYVIDPKHWTNSDGGKIKSLKSPELRNLNVDLNKLKSHIIDEYNKAITADEIIDSKWIKEVINPTLSEVNAPDNLINYFDYYLQLRKNEITNRYAQKFLRAKAICIEVEKRGNKTLKVKDVNSSFKNAFETYCKDCNYSIAYSDKVLSTIKTLCFHALAHGVEINHQIHSFRKNKAKSIKITLSPSELTILENTILEKQHLNIARDWLIISCETAQRVSDFLSFTMNKVRQVPTDGINNNSSFQIIEFEQKKTKKRISIPLTRAILRILEKYNNNFPPKMTPQRYNIYIKEVCKIAQINELIEGTKKDKETNRNITGIFPKYELITSHIGRRSFATNNYISMPTSVIMKATGHSSEKELLLYIGKTQKEDSQILARYMDI